MVRIDGNEWQRQVCRWLRLRHDGLFDQIPDQNMGDWGIEGWSRDGNAYQCYSPQSYQSADDLYSKHRKKMTDDIGKFARNRDALTRLFGPIVIRAWWFVIPRHENKQLNLHAEKKAAEVRSQKLSYCSADFFIHIATPDDFEKERRIELSLGLEEISLPDCDPSAENLIQLAQEEQAGCEILDGKIVRMQIPQAQRQYFRDGWLRLYIKGKTILDYMSAETPDLYYRIRQSLSSKEERLFLEYSNGSPIDIIHRIADELERDVQQSLHNISIRHCKDIVSYAIADWLMRCPLDFPEESQNGTK